MLQQVMKFLFSHPMYENSGVPLRGRCNFPTFLHRTASVLPLGCETGKYTQKIRVCQFVSKVLYGVATPFFSILVVFEKQSSDTLKSLSILCCNSWHYGWAKYRCRTVNLGYCRSNDKQRP